MSTRNEIISRSDLQALIRDDHDVTLVDVLPEESFEEWHIPGAINIPGKALRERAPQRLANKDRTIVVYCASPACTASDKAADVLRDMGYSDVRDYRGGKEHWKEGGLPVEAGQPAGAVA
jgi:rhodanese-related sulfurtransferase